MLFQLNTRLESLERKTNWLPNDKIAFVASKIFVVANAIMKLQEYLLYVSLYSKSDPKGQQSDPMLTCAPDSLQAS